MKNNQATTSRGKATVYGVLFAISGGHLFNDAIQAIVPAMNPVFVSELNLNYVQIGWIAFILNMTSSVLQPVFGYLADKRPTPFLLPAGMFLSMIGVIGFSLFQNYYFILLSVLFIGLGSAIFHPEGSRVAYLAAGTKRGLAQSIYQVGGNFGQSLAPIFTAFIFVKYGQSSALSFILVTVIGMIVLIFVSKWYKTQLEAINIQNEKSEVEHKAIPKQIKMAITLLVFLVFARSWYQAGILNFYQFHLNESYGFTIQHSQLYIFIFMFGGVLGTFLGGPLADRFGRRNLIFISMGGAAPLTIILPFVSENFIIPLTFLIGFIILSSFSVTVVYAQELIPSKIGMVSGLIVGLAFGMGAIGAVILGALADIYSIKTIMIICSFLPLLGIFTFLLPSDKKVSELNEMIE